MLDETVEGELGFIVHVNLHRLRKEGKESVIR